MTASKPKSSGAGGVSVLGAMRAAVMDTAPSAPKPTLTTLPGERPGASNLAGPGLVKSDAFPADVPGAFMSQEALIQHAKNLRSMAAEMLRIAEGIDVMLGVPGAVAGEIARDAETTQKLLEKEADRRVADAAKAEAGDERAKARVEAAPPMEAVVKAAEAKDRKRAEMLATLAESGITAEDTSIDADAAESFADRQARLAAEAQEAVFGPGGTADPRPEPESPFNSLPHEAPEVYKGTDENGADVYEPEDGWTCPTHGKFVKKISTRRQREYRACPECDEFERL